MKQLLHFCLLGVYRPIWNLKTLHSYRDVTIFSEELQNFDIYLALIAIEQWVFFNVPRLLRHGPIVYNVHHLQGYSHLLPSVGAVTTCFNDLGLSRPGIEPRSPACKANALPLYRSFLVEVFSLQIKSSNTNIHKGYANDICKLNLINWFFSDLVVWCKLGYFS